MTKMPTIVIANGKTHPAPSYPSPSSTGVWQFDVDAGEWLPYEPPVLPYEPPVRSQDNDVKDYLRPFIRAHTANLAIHQKMQERIDALMTKGLWDDAAGWDFRRLNSQIANLNHELNIAEQGFRMAMGVLIAVHGRDEACRRYPELAGITEATA